MKESNPEVLSESEVHVNLRPKPRVTKRLKIAIDGPAGAGKSTVSKHVAELLDYLYIDTGAMYRAVTWLAMRNHLQVSDRPAIAKLADKAQIELQQASEPGEKVRVFVSDTEVTNEIRSQQVTRMVSTVAAIPAVREHLVKQQRLMAAKGGVVLDGRDIGTVVLPDADLKIFLTASPEVRAHRRLVELEQAGEPADYSVIFNEIVERDQKDSNRVIAPLRMADDAVLILTDKMTVDEVVSHIVQLVSE